MKSNLKIMRVNEVLPISFIVLAFILLIQALPELLVKSLTIELEEVEIGLEASDIHEVEAFEEEFADLELPFVEALEEVAFRNKDLTMHLVVADNNLSQVVASCREEADSNLHIIDYSNPLEEVDNNSLEDRH